MNSLFIIALVLVLPASLAASELDSEADTATVAQGISAEYEMTYVGKYVWRGLIVNPEPSLQQSVTLSHSNGLSFNWWSATDTTDVSGQKGNITEIDYVLDYGWSLGNTQMSTGLGYYTYPRVGYPATAEVYAIACFNGALSPTISAYYDFKEIDGLYISLGACRKCKLCSGKNLSALNLSASVGYGFKRYHSGYFGVTKSAFSDLTLTATLPIEIGGKFTVTPSISYSALVDNDLKAAVRSAGSKSACFYGGISCSCGF